MDNREERGGGAIEGRRRNHGSNRPRLEAGSELEKNLLTSRSLANGSMSIRQKLEAALFLQRCDRLLSLKITNFNGAEPTKIKQLGDKYM